MNEQGSLPKALNSSYEMAMYIAAIMLVPKILLVIQCIVLTLTSFYVAPMDDDLVLSFNDLVSFVCANETYLTKFIPFAMAINFIVGLSQKCALILMSTSIVPLYANFVIAQYLMPMELGLGRMLITGILVISLYPLHLFIRIVAEYIAIVLLG